MRNRIHVIEEWNQKLHDVVHSNLEQIEDPQQRATLSANRAYWHECKRILSGGKQKSRKKNQGLFTAQAQQYLDDLNADEVDEPREGGARLQTAKIQGKRIKIGVLDTLYLLMRREIRLAEGSETPKTTGQEHEDVENED